MKFGGAVIADSKRAMLLRQYGPGRLPTYYFPRADVRTDALIPASSGSADGDMTYWTVRVADQVAEHVGFALITAATYSINLYLHFILLGLWGVPWMLVGYVVFTHAAKQGQAMRFQTSY